MPSDTIGGERGGQPEWRPVRFALRTRRWQDPRDASPTAVLLRQPTAPFVRHFDAADEAQWRAHAHDYLKAADAYRPATLSSGDYPTVPALRQHERARAAADATDVSPVLGRRPRCLQAADQAAAAQRV